MNSHTSDVYTNWALAVTDLAKLRLNDWVPGD